MSDEKRLLELERTLDLALVGVPITDIPLLATAFGLWLAKASTVHNQPVDVGNMVRGFYVAKPWWRVVKDVAKNAGIPIQEANDEVGQRTKADHQFVHRYHAKMEKT